MAGRMIRYRNRSVGQSLVEFALAIWIFLLIFLGALDFGRFLFNYYHAERAMHLAARIAVVRPPACTGVPDTHEALSGGTTARYGTACRAGNICENYGNAPFTCTGDMDTDNVPDNATVQEIWDVIAGGLPRGSRPSNLNFTYSYDENMGFLGGPFTPEVTVELTGVRFRFLTPLGRMGEMIGASQNSTLDDFSDADGIPFPPMGVSMPGEDLNLGTGG